ncbi:NAD-dependent deacylase [Methylocucumis oryzae]|uniref:NAD-dependent protein deacylase n=1 Tax=Methylocucumis oryzae TaxID=1632867 RepID=A0A0F3IJQ0_9GAMM|nr:NAD-dependent deacylase [Methylocucumis oryzae]KJV06748.1 NAD-dependent deacetylase [Methylocucumis oryzae]
MKLKPTDFIVILTGAGISAESGIRTFRAQDGLWEEHRIEDVATPEGFMRNPELVHAFYNQRRRQLQEASVMPNPAHLALTRLEQQWPGDVLIITQNVDNLHERAGSQKLLHMHGELNKIFCQFCKTRLIWNTDLSTETACPHCGNVGMLRPDIVWFGETPYHMDEILRALAVCQLFISIGTSGLVYPAAKFAQIASQAYRIETNLQETEISGSFNKHLIGPAGSEIPKLIEALLAREFLV